MRGLLGFVLQRCISNKSGLLISRELITTHRPQTSWLSSVGSAPPGSGVKRGSGQKRTNPTGQHPSSSAKGDLKAGRSQLFKGMANVVREKTTAGGDKVSSDQVKHDRSSQRFTLELGNNQLARIDYRSIGPEGDRIEMYHSEVPKELRGRGLGKALAKGALELAARENMRVKLTCTYLIDFANKSKDFKGKKNH